MWKACSTVKLFFFLLLILMVEVSSARNIRHYWSLKQRTGLYKHGNVTITMDIVDVTPHAYTANVTIFNYLKDLDIRGTWELGWTWKSDEILVNTLEANGTQHGFVPLKKAERLGFKPTGYESCCVNKVSFMDLPAQADNKKIAPSCCKGGAISSWHKEADLKKSSTSFQISVARESTPRFLMGPVSVTFTVQGFETKCEFDFMTARPSPGFVDDKQYTPCALDVEKLRKIYEKEL